MHTFQEAWWLRCRVVDMRREFAGLSLPGGTAGVLEQDYPLLSAGSTHNMTEKMLTGALS